ncbi:hypothetical protein TNCV_5075611 [Trichonephila clavipes]|uniref:Uncharacterized protein n=1 Tax=Trichonephila clavipes TaxID=2585209 RepID=A0A8X6RU40_TRICX|nr:hypothetical protein TNCV_5075611 [Trichonephila clavipes]
MHHYTFISAAASEMSSRYNSRPSNRPESSRRRCIVRTGPCSTNEPIFRFRALEEYCTIPQNRVFNMSTFSGASGCDGIRCDDLKDSFISMGCIHLYDNYG